MSIKQPIRWDWIEDQWQLGRLSNVQIAKQHNEQFGREVAESAIRKRAGQYGWQRELSEAVRHETRRKLAQGVLPAEVRESANESASPDTVVRQVSLVETAADEAVAITLRHRDDADKIRRNARLIEAHVLDDMALNPDGSPVKKYEPGELKDMASVLKTASELRGRAVDIERKAFNLEADEPPKVVIEFDQDPIARPSRGAEEAPFGEEEI